MNTTQQTPFRKLAARAALVLGVALLAAAPQTARAQSASDLGVASDFNVFTFGDAKQTDVVVKGRAAFGGYADLFGFYIGEDLTNSHGQRHDLIVGDSLRYHHGIVYNGNVRYGIEPEDFGYAEIRNGTLRRGKPLDFDAAEADLLARSTEWAGFKPDGTVTEQGTSVTLNGAEPGLNVFAVSGAALSNADDLTINAPEGSTVLVNVSGTTVAMGSLAFTLNGVDRQRVLYHFAQATTLTLTDDGIEGTVFAPYAGVGLYGSVINGQLVAASITGTGTFYHLPFSGSIGGSAGGGQNLPVELARFEALTNGQTAQLVWETASETSNAGFEVQHAIGGGAFQKRTFVGGRGTTLEGQRYSYLAADLAPGTHRFRLKQVDLGGAVAYSPVVEVAVEMPDRFEVKPAYPNPFNPQTALEFRVRQAQRVTVSLYNALGQRVRVLQEGMVQADQAQTVRIDGASLASGTYLVRIAGADFAQTQRIVLIK